MIRARTRTTTVWWSLIALHPELAVTEPARRKQGGFINEQFDLRSPKVEDVPTVELNGTTYKVPFEKLLPRLTEEELKELRADIEANGVTVPIVVTDEGEVLDGHHRLMIAVELGLTEIPIEVLKGLTADQKRQRGLALNLRRRHLNREQKCELIATQLKADTSRSNNQIAKELGVDDKTVKSVREELEANSGIPKLRKTRGRDGHTRPANRKTRKPKASSPKAVDAPKPADPPKEGDPPVPPVELDPGKDAKDNIDARPATPPRGREQADEAASDDADAEIALDDLIKRFRDSVSDLQDLADEVLNPQTRRKVLETASRLRDAGQRTGEVRLRGGRPVIQDPAPGVEPENTEHLDPGCSGNLSRTIGTGRRPEHRRPVRSSTTRELVPPAPSGARGEPATHPLPI